MHQTGSSSGFRSSSSSGSSLCIRAFLQFGRVQSVAGCASFVDHGCSFGVLPHEVNTQTCVCRSVDGGFKRNDIRYELATS